MAKIDTSKIEGYANMTPEQKLAALEGFEYEDNSAELEKQKNALSKANSEAAEWKRKHNALLSEEEKKKQEDADKLAQMEQELADLRKGKTVSEYKAKFVAQGYDEALAEETPLRPWLTAIVLRSLPTRASSSKSMRRRSKLTQSKRPPSLVLVPVPALVLRGPWITARRLKRRRRTVILPLLPTIPA